MTEYRNKNVAVLGFGLEGKDSARFLIKRGAQVSVYDRKREQELDFSGFDEKKFKLYCGEDYLSGGLNEYDIIFRSPGVYRHLPELVSAENRGAKVTSAIKSFFELCPAKIIGITGTKGKGTTSTLIYKILKKSGKEVYLAGNIGKPYLELLSKLDKESWLVLEISSFQLIDLDKSPHIGVVLNITEDHLDWHKDDKEYIRAKENIIRTQKKGDFAVINTDYDTSKDFAKLSKGKVFYFSKREKIKGSYVDKGKIILSVDEKINIGNVSALKLKGKHNWENVCAAVCTSYLAGADVDSIKSVTFSFKGLEHRLEEVREVGGITFYNDSFSTNSETTIAAINSFNQPLTLILGGSDKGLSYEKLAREISESKNVKTLIIIGKISSVISNAIKKIHYKGKVLKLEITDIGNIVKIAYNNTPKNGVVLLSPATASFDMFKNYKDRGEKFKEAVKLL